MATIGTVSDLYHRPVWICWGPVATAVNLGFLEGGVTIDFEDSVVEQKASQTGDLTLEAYHKQGPVTVTANISQIADLDILDMVFPFGSKQVSDASPPENRFSSDPASVGLTTPYAGRKMSTVANILRIIPVDEYTDAVTETTNQFVVFKAYPANWGQWQLDIENSLAPEIQFKSLYDTTTAQEGQSHWMVGKISAADAWVAA